MKYQIYLTNDIRGIELFAYAHTFQDAVLIVNNRLNRKIIGDSHMSVYSKGEKLWGKDVESLRY